MSESQSTDDTTSSTDTDQLTDFEIIEDAATLAYAVYRRVDFDKVSNDRHFDDEFVGHIESATFTESVMGFHSALADQAEVRAVDSMTGDTRGIIRKYDDHDGIARSRRFLRVVRNNPAHAHLEMQHEHVGGNGGGGQ